MPSHHHAHPHRHGRSGVHGLRHGYTGAPVSRRDEQVPWLYWFAEPAYVEPYPPDEDRLETLLAPGEGSAP
ncbi:MAG: hypothetical protein ACHQ01_04600 [Candidatus Limnocylindrales bacterium]